MANDLKIQGVVEVSTEGVESALNRVGTTADGMARKIEASAATAGKAVDSIGSGAGNSANEFTRAEGKIVASIKRATTQLELLGKTASQRLEFKINTQGLDASKFEPALAKLRELEAAQVRVGTAGRGMGQGLQNTSYQLQDFIVQVNGGVDATRALSMQLPQMLVGFGAAGAAIGVVAALLPNLVSAFSDAGEGAKDFKGAMSDFDKAIGNVGSTVKTFDMEALYEQFNKSSAAVRAATIEQLNFQQEYIRTTQLVAGKKFGESLGGLGEFGGLDRLAGAFAGSGAEKLAGQLGLSVEVAKDLLPVLNGLKAGTQDVNEAFGRFGTVLLGGNAKAVELAATMNELAKSERDGAAAASAISEAQAKMAAGHVLTKKEAEALAKAQKTVAKETEALADLLDAINGKSSQFDSSYVKNVNLLLTAYGNGKLSLDQFNEAFDRYVAMQPGAVASAKELAKAEQYRAKLLGDETARLLEKAKASEDELAMIGLSADQIATLTARRYDEQIAIKAAEAERLRGIDGREAEVYLIEQQISALQRLKNAEVTKPQLKAQADAWQNFTRDIERSLTDALMRSFESGDSFGKAFAKNIQNLFKTMVLKVAIQGTVNAGLNAVGLGGQSGGADLLGLAQNGSSLYSAATGGGIYGAISGFGAGAASMASEMALGSAFVGPSASLAGGAVGAGASAASATGAGSALSSVASAAPYVAAAVAAYMLADSMFGSKGGPKTEGNAYGVIGANGLDIITAADFAAPFGDGNWGRPGAQAEQMQTVVDSFGDSLANFAKTLGGDASGLGIALGFNTDPQGDAPDNIMGSVLDAAGNALYRSVYDVERGTAQQAITAESQRVMLAALQEIDLQDWADAIVDSVNPATASVEQITAALDSLTAMQTLIPVFESLGVKSENVSTAMVSIMGGFDSAAAALNSYYENFYTETERTARLTENVTTAMENLGLAMPATREEFRAIVESLDMTTSAGQATYAALMNLAPAFVQVSDAAAQAAQIAAKAAADALAQANTLAIDAVNSAFDALANSVAAQKDALSKSHAQQMTSLQAAANNATAALNTLSSLAETLKGASASLNTSDADRLAARQSAMATLDAAYATAQTGGSLAPLTDGIKSAISELQKPSEDLYSSFTEYMVAQARYGSIITSLTPYAEGQKSAAQMTLDAVNAGMSDAESSYQAQVDSLDSLVTSAASQVNLLKGIDDSVKSVKTAIDALHSTVRGAALTGIQAGTTTPTAAAEIIKNTGVDLVSESWNQVQTANGTQDIYLSAGGAIGLDGRIYSIAGTSMAAGDVVAWINAKVAQGDASGTDEGRRAAYIEIYNAAVSNGVSAASLDKLMGLSPGTANQIAAMLGMPAFARGGLASGWSLVGEEGPELVNFTNPARVYTASQTADALGGASSEEIRALRADQQAQSAAFAALMARVSKVLEKWDGDGMPEVRVTA